MEIIDKKEEEELNFSKSVQNNDEPEIMEIVDSSRKQEELNRPRTNTSERKNIEMSPSQSAFSNLQIKNNRLRMIYKQKHLLKVEKEKGEQIIINFQR